MLRIFKYAILFGSVLGLFTFLSFNKKEENKDIPVIAIANYGPHFSLEETIRGIKEGLEKQGFKDQQNIRYVISDVNFESSLLPQMLSKLSAHSPRVMVALTTPVAQLLKNTHKVIPVVFAAVTDPLEAGLIASPRASQENVTGCPDQQNLSSFLKFALELLPESKTVGILYASGEANDIGLVKLLKSAAQKVGLSVVSVPIEHPRDIPQRMQQFKGHVDFIYVGLGGTIQPALPAIVAQADQMKIPVFNADSDAVKKNQVLGSYGVSPYAVGVNTASIIARLLKGEKISNISPIYPSSKDHQGFVSKARAKEFGISSLSHLQDIMIVE